LDGNFILSLFCQKEIFRVKNERWARCVVTVGDNDPT
jgi:hypothetical protein